MYASEAVHAMSDERASWYELRAGRRHVLPYKHPFTCHAKGRWIGRTVLDVLSDEFPDEFTDAASIDAAAEDRRLILNGKAASASATFDHGDKLVHLVLRSEPSVPAAPIELLLCEADLLAVNKPAGMPVHHAGRYRRNSLVEILQTERPELGLGGGGGGGAGYTSCTGSIGKSQACCSCHGPAQLRGY